MLMDDTSIAVDGISMRQRFAEKEQIRSLRAKIKGSGMLPDHLLKRSRQLCANFPSKQDMGGNIWHGQTTLLIAIGVSIPAGLFNY